MKKGSLIGFILLLFISLLFFTGLSRSRQQRLEEWIIQWDLALSQGDLPKAKELLNDSPIFQKQDPSFQEQKKQEYQWVESRENWRRILQESMLEIPGTTFMMGDDWDGMNPEKNDEIPVHPVTLDPFRMMATEVTHAMALALLEFYPEEWILEDSLIIHKKSDLVLLDPGARHSGFQMVEGTLELPEENADLPVNEITWYGSVYLCNLMSRLSGLPEAYDMQDLSSVGSKGYRLPSEAEWEWAAGGESEDPYAGGSDPEELAWYFPNSEGQSRPVGFKKPNSFGLYDMSGNVYEWCQDWYDEDYYARSPENNPTGPKEGLSRVIRGGSYSDRAFALRVSFRFFRSPRAEQGFLGFRPVLP